MRVRVVGAGVVGLSCAARLLDAGVDVEVVAREHGGATTSAVAAAMWYPYHVGPADRVRAWGLTALAELTRLAAEEPASGVALRDGSLLLRAAAPPPDWADDVPGFAATDAAGALAVAAVTAGAVGGAGVVASAGPYAGAWSFPAPVADALVYLGWLRGRVESLGGAIRTAEVGGLDEALDGVDRVVLATGLGAAALPGDSLVTGGRGQVVRVRAPGITRWTIDDDHPDGMVYVIPRGSDVVCGGTDVAGSTGGGGAAGSRPDPAVAAAILRRCAEVVPEVAGAEVVGHAVGARPLRPEVRLERDPVSPAVVHCYGHGGAGFTLAWGCAGDVRDLITA